MITKKTRNDPELFLISSRDIDAKDIAAAKEGSYIGDHPKTGNPALHTLTFVNHTLHSLPVGVHGTTRFVVS